MEENAPIAPASTPKPTRVRDARLFMKTKEQIDELIEDVKELGSRIRSIDNLIAAIADPALRDKYNKDLLALIQKYKQMLGLLEKDISEYARYEREEKIPVNLSYRRILKTLREV